MHRFLIAIFAFLVMAAQAPCYADDRAWTVVRATAQVTYTLDQASWQPVTSGMTVPNGAWIATGPRGRAVMKRGVESVTFHPETLASITTSGFFTRQTEILQPAGTLDLEIQKRSRPHTTVQTPFLAAVVKGTIFTVSVSKKAAGVAVTRGLVNVKSLQSGQQTDVGPGQVANVSARKGMTTSGKVSAPSIEDAPPAAAKVSTETAPSFSVAESEAVSSKAGSKSTSSASESKSGNAAHGSGSKGDRGAPDGKGDKGGNGNGHGEHGESHGNGNGGHGSGDAHGSSDHGNGGGNGHGNGNGNGNGGGHGNGGGDGPGNGGGHGNGNGGGRGRDK